MIQYRNLLTKLHHKKKKENMILGGKLGWSCDPSFQNNGWPLHATDVYKWDKDEYKISASSSVPRLDRPRIGRTKFVILRIKQ